MKSSCVFAAALTALFALSLCGCASGRGENAVPQVGEIAAGEGTSVIELGRKSGDTLLEAFQKNDFEMVKNLPFGDEKNTMTEERFRQVVEKVIRGNGGLRSYVYLTDLNAPPYKMLLWKVTFTPEAKTPPDGESSAKEAAPAEGADMLFEMWMGKLNGQYRIVGFRFKL